MLFLLACHSEQKVDPVEVGAYQLLFSGQSPYKDPDNPGIWETDTDFNETWRMQLEGEQGGFGAVRLEDQTLIARLTQPPDPNLAVELVDKSGAPSWSYDTSQGGSLVFPHGVARTPWGQYLVADVFTSRIMAVNPEGGVDWQMYTFDLEASPSGFGLGMVDGRPMLVVTLLGESPEARSFTDQVHGYWLSEDGLERAWTWPETPDPSVASWVHGAHFQLDGSLLVSVAGLGKIVELDPRTGQELRRFPEENVLAFPRDAVILPWGDMVVVDAVELLRVEDPFGEFNVVDAADAMLVFSVDMINCQENTCF